jgi:F-type H+-transporting ATPase subunit alpha
VSRVGGNAQIKAMKKVAGTLRLDLAQFREMAAFAQFASDLDAATRAQLERGKRLVELLKQGQYVPLPVEKQVVIVYAGTNGYTDKLPVDSLRQYEEELYRYIDEKHADLWGAIRDKRELNDEIKGTLDKALKSFGKKFASGGESAKSASAEG